MQRPDHDWFFPQWLDTLRLKQARIVELTGWSKGKVSKLYNGEASYNRAIVNEAAWALNIQPYELLMHPEDAMALRRLRQSAITIAAEKISDYRSEGDEGLRQIGEK